MNREISKRLSPNDVGATSTHQAGILVPKDPKVLSFFPSLDSSQKNPRLEIAVREERTGGRWKFMFIYYNNRLFGGTRNEYRLTCMTEFLRSANAKAGDELRFFLDGDYSYCVDLRRAANDRVNDEAPEYSEGILVLSGGWKVIDF